VQNAARQQRSDKRNLAVRDSTKSGIEDLRIPDTVVERSVLFRCWAPSQKMRSD